MLRRLALLLVPVAASAADPDAYDPVLDDGPGPRPRQERLERPDPRAPGFMLSAHFGLYAGHVESYLTAERSKLESGARGAVGFGFGYRTRSLIELGVDFGLGLGRTYEAELDDRVFAFDLLVQPRVLAHAYETDRFSLYAGAGADVILFDVESAGLNQAGIGPALIAGLLYRLDGHSLLYLEGSAGWFHDFLAYSYEEPGEEALALDPTAPPERIEGEWFNIFRLTVGYRLCAF